jgi:hypothetical protein
MNTLTPALRRPRRRIAELSPWLESEVEPVAGYGCVDWYVYTAAEAPMNAPASGERPQTGTAGLLRVLPPEPPARRH